jgi:Zn-dependent protease with chaperone function
MPTVLRAAVSVAMLVGFYVLGLVQVALAGGLIYLIWSNLSGFGAAKVSWLLIAALGAVLAGLWRALRAKPGEPHGLLLSPEQAPELWRTVREMATEVGTRAPDEIRLVPEVNAAVSEDTKWLGLVGGRRRLYIGMPLLLTFTVDQMRSVLAHELGHYSGSHTRLSAIAYRGRLAMHETLSRVGKWNLFGWVFKGYGVLFRLVSNTVARRQELEADLASVRIAGVGAATSAMREIPLVDAAWDFYFGRYISYGWELGYAPDDVFGGFAKLYQARADELAALREEEPDSVTSRWDTHPSTADRITAMRAAPPAAHTADGRAATALLPGVEGAARELQHEVVDFGTRTVLPWPEFTAASMTQVLQNRADRVFRTAARVAGIPQAGLAEVFALVEAGRVGELAAEFHPQSTREEATRAFADRMADLIALAAVRSGVARWEHSWSKPARLTGPDGEPADYSAIAELAVRPETLGEARSRLAEIGVHVEHARVEAARATADGADVIGAIPNTKVDGEHTDVIMLDRGLILMAAPKSTDDGDKRVMGLLAENRADDLARAHRFVAYEEVAGAKVERSVPLRAELTLHDGRTLRIEERWTASKVGKSADTMLEILNKLAAR